MSTYSSVNVEPDEYEPLNGSSIAPSQRNAYMVAGGTAALLLTAFAYMSGGSTAAVAQAPAMMANAAAPVVAQAAAATAEAVEAVAATVVTQTLPVAAGAGLSFAQFSLVYNSFSFAIAAMGAATVFFFFQFSLVNKEFKTAMVISGLVTLIAFYHYVRIFNSWNDTYTVTNGIVAETGAPFNDAYRYVDWLLTVPLLLMELILVMGLPADETAAQCKKLGGLAALMIILGYPGEVAADAGTRQMFWFFAMIPFVMIVHALYVGLKDAVDKQPEEARDLVSQARLITVLSWSFYPIVYLFPVFGVSGAQAKVMVQVGYSLADVIAKPIMGIICWRIAAAKSGSH